MIKFKSSIERESTVSNLEEARAAISTTVTDGQMNGKAIPIEATVSYIASNYDARNKEEHSSIRCVFASDVLYNDSRIDENQFREHNNVEEALADVAVRRTASVNVADIIRVNDDIAAVRAATTQLYANLLHKAVEAGEDSEVAKKNNVAFRFRNGVHLTSMLKGATFKWHAYVTVSGDSYGAGEYRYTNFRMELVEVKLSKEGKTAVARLNDAVVNKTMELFI